MTAYHDARDVLCKVRENPPGTMDKRRRLLTDSAAFDLAPHFVGALRAAVQEMALLVTGTEVMECDVERCVTAGIEKMGE